MTGVDELYAVRPEEFVATRNALAKELKAGGAKEDAAAVAKLRRPSPTAWALNQVARNDADLVAAALDAGERLRVASDDAVAGRPEGLREATAAERAAGAAVAKAAGALLGARASSLQNAVLGTLRAAALDATVADELRRGVLTTEHEQSGFGFGLDLGDAPVVERTSRPAKKATPRPALRAVPDLEPDDEAEDDTAAREEAKAARAAAREAERRRKKEQAARQRTADRLAKEASRLAREADDAEALAVEARQRADDARGRAEQAAEAVRALDPA